MHGADLILILLAQVGVILLLSRVMGLLFARLHQPQVMGEMVAGIMLGPSLLGWLAPDFYGTLFPPGSVQYLNVLSQVGVIFFLFLIGLELDPKLIRSRGHAAVVISHVSIIAPFLLGAILALLLYPLVFTNTPTMRFTSVALFMGAAMSITAFPVLARILTERNLHKTNVGAVAITCAAIDDVTAWCMLAFVVGIARARGIEPALLTAGLSLVYVLAMFFLVRPFLRRLQTVYERQGRLSQNVVALVFLLTLASAYATEAIGIHALFGAFLMGAIMPKGTQFVRHLSEKLEDYTVVLLLPVFFAYTGLRTQIGLLNSGELWLITGLIILVACMGKFGGSTLAARACGLGWRESAAIGTLMNTRGLMELVILNIGRELGVITDAVFAMMVIMALVTTALTTPVLHLVYPARLFGKVMAPREIVKRAFTLLIPVADPRSGGHLVRIASMICGTTPGDARIVALHLRRPADHEAYRADVNAPEPEDQTLAPLLSAASKVGLEVEPLSFMSRDIADDIATVARIRQVNLVLMGFHKPVIGHALLGGTVHRVLENAPSDAAVFVDRGLESAPMNILVPYLGTPHDRLAMDLAGRIGRSTGGQLTVLHVVPPERQTKLGAQQDVEKAFQDPAQPTPVKFKVVPTDNPVAAVLAEAAAADLIVVGAGEEWDLESRFVNLRPQRIAQQTDASLLIVRKLQAPASAPASITSPTPVPNPSHSCRNVM